MPPFSYPTCLALMIYVLTSTRLDIYPLIPQATSTAYRFYINTALGAPLLRCLLSLGSVRYGIYNDL